MLRRSSWAVALTIAIGACASVHHGTTTIPRPRRGVGSGDELMSAARELTPDEQVTHVLSRLAFGPRPGDAERVKAMGVDRWIAQQLAADSIDDSAASEALAPIPSWTESQMSDDVALSLSETTTILSSFRRVESAGVILRIPDSTKKYVVKIPTTAQNIDRFAAGKVIRAEVSERQLVEVMADFWENHFSVYSRKVSTPLALIEFDRNAIRPRVLGKFRDLLGAVAHSPAMLFYLDNQLSKSTGLNENYARELLELHTMGVDGGYTQQDVGEVARALTGWAITFRKFEFRATVHDTGRKVVLGHTLAAGRGIEDGEDVLDILARQPATARFIATKLARRFVSDTPPPALVARAAATFTRTDGDIAEVMRTIVTSPEFFSRAAFRAKTKTPFELVVSAQRAMQSPVDTTPATVKFLSELGQPVFGHVSPEGWPDDGAAWMNSGALLKRVLFAADMAEGKLAFAPVNRWQGWWIDSLPPDKAASAVLRLILGGVASSGTREAMLAATGAPDARLREMVAIALGAPEFQRR